MMHGQKNIKFAVILTTKMLHVDRLRLDYIHLTFFWAVHAEGMHGICLAQQCVWLLTSVTVFSCLVSCCCSSVVLIG